MKKTSRIPSIIYCTDSAARIIAMTREKTFINFLLRNSPHFEIITKKINVIVITLTKEAILTNCLIKLSPNSLIITITDVIAAGPERIGIAKGKIDTFSLASFTICSFLCCLLLKSISKAIIKSINPPAILKEAKEILRYPRMNFPIKENAINITVAINIASIEVCIFSLVV